ncbi:MAG: outer membrane lipoprotein-sorting protein [Candidatus Thiodiazotropha sp.]
MRIPKLPTIILSLLIAPAWAAGDPAETRGLELAVEADRRDSGFKDFRAGLSMLLRNRSGEESLRHLRVHTLEMADDGDKTLIIFDQPPDVRGTALLTYSHKQGADDQWLYLPALKRVKRISSRNKSGPFMGSEFAYEDLASQEVEKYSYRYLRDEILEGREVFVIERDPVDKNSGYTRQEVWLDKEHYYTWKVLFYDRKNSHLKTLVFSGYQQYLDQFWRAEKMFMENHQTGKSTLLTWRDYSFRTGLKDTDFNKNSLKRAK